LSSIQGKSLSAGQRDVPYSLRQILAGSDRLPSDGGASNVIRLAHILRFMHFILHSETDEESIAERMGHADYRYYFILRSFQPALERIGTVEVVHDPSRQVDDIFDRHTAAGEDAIFFYFGPPDKAPLGFRCPMVIVLAWEYSTLPNEIWDEFARSDWRVTLAALGGAIVPCSYTARVVKSVMGENYPVTVVSGAIWEKVENIREAVVSQSAPASVEFLAYGTVLDTTNLGLSADRLISPRRPKPPSTNGVSADAEARLENAEFTAPADDPLHDLILEHPHLLNLPPNVKPGAGSNGVPVRLDGAVYTTFMDPVNERKNMHDLVTAFCYAFRFTADATLVLKMVHWNVNVYRDGLLLLLSRLGPLKCRVVAIHAFLDDEAMAKLASVTTFYVNASYCEAMCQSLMEFMSFGKPAIAPFHTAMADYIDKDVAFIPECASEYSMWPNDPRQMWRCDRYRIEWDSLQDAYLKSYDMAKNDRPAYDAMGKRAMARIRERSAAAEASERICEYLEQWSAQYDSAVAPQLTLPSESS
jgi:glycosyltransferase involved in cell wall biosynthesis